MCRSSSSGGRRCPSHHDHERTRALNTAHRRVERARIRLRHATDTGDHAAVEVAQQQFDQAQQRLADTQNHYQRKETPAQDGDTTETTSDHDETPNAENAGQQDDEPNADTAQTAGGSGPFVFERNDVNYGNMTMNVNAADRRVSFTRDETPGQRGDTTTAKHQAATASEHAKVAQQHAEAALRHAHQQLQRAHKLTEGHGSRQPTNSPFPQAQMNGVNFGTTRIYVNGELVEGPPENT